VGKVINKIDTMKYNKMPPIANYGYWSKLSKVPFVINGQGGKETCSIFKASGG
jgi:hypothetical protein